MRKRNIQIAALCLVLGLMTAPNLPAQEKAEETASTTTIVDSTMTVKLRGDLELKGTPVELETVQVHSLFGVADLPLHTIAGVRFAQDANEQTTVVLQNGDVLTGELAIEDLKFIADWGEATVHVAHVRSIVFRPDLVWSPVKSGNGTRWRLTKQNATAQANQSRSTNSQQIRYYRSSSR